LLLLLLLLLLSPSPSPSLSLTHPPTHSLSHGQVFPSAFHSAHNLLVCAPTGAGKTGVAMSVILREVREEARSARGARRLVVYVAPLKALATEVCAVATRVQRCRGHCRAPPAPVRGPIRSSTARAAARQVTRTLSGLLRGVNKTVVEVTGDFAVPLPDLRDVSVIVCTPEKWDVVTRKPAAAELAGSN